MRIAARSKDDFWLPIASAIATAIAAAGAEAWLKGEIDWTTALIALVGTVGGLLIGMLCIWFKEPAAMHNELVDALNAQRKRVTLAGVLIERERDLQLIKPIDVDDADAVDIARKQMVSVQEMVVQELLLSDDWPHAPSGWDDIAPPIIIWSVLAGMFHARYPTQLRHFMSLCNSRGEFTANTLPHEVEYSIRVITLIRREIEVPEIKYLREADGTFESNVRIVAERYRTDPPVRSE